MSEPDIREITELGRKISCVLGLSRVNHSQMRSIGSLAADFRRQNGNFVIEIPVDVKLLEQLGNTKTWSKCHTCQGKGYSIPVRFFPRYALMCKECGGEGGRWYESD